MNRNIYFLDLSPNVFNNSLAFIGSSGGDFIKSGFREAHKGISADLRSLEDFSTNSARRTFPASARVPKHRPAVMCVFFVCSEALATLLICVEIKSSACLMKTRLENYKRHAL